MPRDDDARGWKLSDDQMNLSSVSLNTDNARKNVPLLTLYNKISCNIP